MFNKEQKSTGGRLWPGMETRIVEEAAKDDVNYLIHYLSAEIFSLWYGTVETNFQKTAEVFPSSTQEVFSEGGSPLNGRGYMTLLHKCFLIEFNKIHSSS